MVVSPLSETISRSPTPVISFDCDARHSADDLHLLPADALHSAVTCSESHRRRPRTPLPTPPLEKCLHYNIKMKYEECSKLVVNQYSPRTSNSTIPIKLGKTCRQQISKKLEHIPKQYHLSVGVAK
ncbi:uncharacterized protein LOC116022935 [Ipomoea triloba]|uniref:uncharacterized protein LOC116022935 n=1 Tax=Ipomoea triloba TaxID=35885 RepID=UPI00125D3C70|nr:uncharacterized protein LOC116022935 [Ipomoea triloba]